MSQDDSTPADALRALQARGVNEPADLLDCGTPDEILAACHRWDRQQNVKPGLLVYWIRNSHFEDPTPPSPPPSKGAQLRARFDEYARRFPPGTAAEPHRRLIARRWPDDIAYAAERGEDVCGGDMVVTEATYPLLTMECDECGFEAAIPPRDLHVLDRYDHDEEATEWTGSASDQPF